MSPTLPEPMRGIIAPTPSLRLSSVWSESSIAVWGPQLTGINGLVMADEAAAILASGVILITARHLIRPALRELLDATSHELAAKVIAIAERVEGVRFDREGARAKERSRISSRYACAGRSGS
jgi:divalent metal cation (Fe/Co/Zn/Cd) transporter